MSGPIIRKYGFPNHEQIFGHRPLEHGADAEAMKPADETAKPAEKADEPKAKKAAPKKKK